MTPVIFNKLTDHILRMEIKTRDGRLIMAFELNTESRDVDEVASWFKFRLRKISMPKLEIPNGLTLSDQITNPLTMVERIVAYLLLGDSLNIPRQTPISFWDEGGVDVHVGVLTQYSKVERIMTVRRTSDGKMFRNIPIERFIAVASPE